MSCRPGRTERIVKRHTSDIATAGTSLSSGRAPRGGSHARSALALHRIRGNFSPTTCLSILKEASLGDAGHVSPECVSEFAELVKNPSKRFYFSVKAVFRYRTVVLTSGAPVALDVVNINLFLEIIHPTPTKSCMSWHYG